MIFDVEAPKSSQFKKPVFGSKTLLRDQYGKRTGFSNLLSAGIGFASGFSPLGAEVGQKLDNLIQNNNVPSYLKEQDWYANNVETSNAKGQQIGQISGMVGTGLKDLGLTVASVMTGLPLSGLSKKSKGNGAGEKATSSIPTPDAMKSLPMKPTEDPSKTFQSLLSKKSVVMTPEQRRLSQVNSQRQMLALPTYDSEVDNNMSSDNNPFRFYLSDTPSIVPNFLKLR